MVSKVLVLILAVCVVTTLVASKSTSSNKQETAESKLKKHCEHEAKKGLCDFFKCIESKLIEEDKLKCSSENDLTEHYNKCKAAECTMKCVMKKLLSKLEKPQKSCSAAMDKVKKTAKECEPSCSGSSGGSSGGSKPNISGLEEKLKSSSKH